MAVLFPQGKLGQPRSGRPVSLFPAKDEMDILGEERTAWDKASGATLGSVNSDKIINDDGSINWWEIVAPLLATGVGAAFGGERGALLGGSAGAGYLQGRVEADERFRKNRLVDATMKQQAEDRKLRHIIDLLPELRKTNPKLAADVMVKLMRQSDIAITPEDATKLNEDYMTQEEQAQLNKTLERLEDEKTATPESLAQALDIRIQKYKKLFLSDPTEEDIDRLYDDTQARIERMKWDEVEKKKKLEELDLDIANKRLERYDRERKLGTEQRPKEETDAIEFAERMLADGKFTPSQAVESVERRVALDPDRKAELRQQFGGFVLRPLTNLGEEQKKKIGGAETIQEISERALDRLEDPKVMSALGRVSGAKTSVESWVTGKATMPSQVQDFLISLGFTVDYISRKQSGAALTVDEVSFYRTLVGTALTDPAALRQSFVSMIQMMEQEKQAIYKLPMRIAEGGRISAETQGLLDSLRFRSKHVDAATGLAKQPTEGLSPEDEARLKVIQERKAQIQRELGQE